MLLPLLLLRVTLLYTLLLLTLEAEAVLEDVTNDDTEVIPVSVLSVRHTPGSDLCLCIEFAVLQHNGDIEHLFSRLLELMRSGDNARRNSGELSSVLFGRTNPFFDTLFIVVWPLGRLPGLYDCVVFDEPGWCPTGNANGLGDRVGDAGIGDGDGVLANGESGMCPIDFRRLGAAFEGIVCNPFAVLLLLLCSLCLSPCNVDGL